MVWEINMVCTRLEFDNIMFINCLGYDFYIYGALEFYAKIVSEYDQEIPQSQTADNTVAPRGRAAQPSRDTIADLWRHVLYHYNT